jgi:fumarylpyruvate hydrolase
MKPLGNYIFKPHPIPSAAILGREERFPVHRIYCVGRNYEDHAKEMGHSGKEPPFFFLKPADSLVAIEENQVGSIPYPSLTQNFHYEIEMVIAIEKEGKNIPAENALDHVFGYAVGLDMTRRDL